MSTGALVVAAGLSSRMGAFKPMLPVGNETLLRRGLRILLQSGCFPVAVVIGRERETVLRSLADVPVHCIYNPDFASCQMFDSVRLGLSWLASRCSRVVFSPGDVSLYQPETVAALMETDAPVCLPEYNGVTGHPILISSEVFPAILSDSGEEGLAGALKRASVPVAVPVNDPGILMDADTPEDYQRILAYADSIQMG